MKGNWKKKNITECLRVNKNNNSQQYLKKKKKKYSRERKNKIY